ncbi:LysR family transcriptional regulator [Candidatus Thioglobus sp.]|nr:LysR family transcriptional regulator [Candidatus Thioglobus sp.]
MNAKILDGMVIFTMVVDSNGFSSAARLSGHSTSHLSKVINRLESRLGVLLLNRTTRTISLTPEGELYYRQCVNIINEAKAVEQQLEGQRLEPQGNLKISCPVSFGIYKLQPLILEYMDKYPKVNIELNLEGRYVDIVGEGFNLVFRGAIKLEDSNLISRKIHSSKIATLASPKYLEKYGSPVHPKDLSKHKTIGLNHIPQYNIWRYISPNTKKETRATIKSHTLTNNEQMALELCIAGKGITRLPLFNLREEIKKGELIELFGDYQPIVIDVFIVYPSRQYIPAKVKSFIDFVSDRLK